MVTNFREFRNYNNMFYSDCAPVFVLGEFPAMPAERLD